MTQEDKEWLAKNMTFGQDEIDGQMVPWVGAPNKDDHSWTMDEILEAIAYRKELKDGDKGRSGSL